MMPSPTSVRRLLPALLAFVVAGPALANEWQAVMRDRDRLVQIDRSSIIPSDGGTKVAWGRIVLGGDEARKMGYAMIKALNRYDCLNRSFHTIKRVYLDSEEVVLREEGVIDQTQMMVARNSVDERMWREVCKPASATDLDKVAADAGRAAAEAGKAPRPATADRASRKDAGKELEPATPAEVPAARSATRSAAAERRAAESRAEARITRTAAALDTATPAAEPMMAPASAKPATTTAQGGTPAPAPAAAPAPTRLAAVPRSAPAPVAATAPARSSRAAPAASGGKADAARLLAHQEIHWSYEGETGPDHWARLRPEWKLCSDGKRQSPIDIRDGIAVDLDPVQLDYRSTRFRINDNGHTVQVDVGEGLGMEVRGRRYELVQFHFHRPSEERIGGRAFDMVAHFVHRDVDGRLAVLAVLLERGEQPNPVVQTLWNNLPLERGASYMPATQIDLREIVPASPEHYLYMGSLTTPPCTEDVLWVVMKQPVQVSDEQIRIFARLYPRNIRTLQQANGRLILESR